MKKRFVIVLVLILTSIYSVRSHAQTSDSVLREKVIILPGFRKNIIPYIDFKNSSSVREKMHIESHVLSSDMTIEDMIVSFGVRAMEVRNMLPLLTNALISGELKGIKLIQRNLFVVYINHGSYDTEYIINLFWSPSHNSWALDAHPAGDVYAKKGMQVFNSY